MRSVVIPAVSDDHPYHLAVSVTRPGDWTELLFYILYFSSTRSTQTFLLVPLKIMKRLKKLSVKTTVLGRSGRSTIRVPLSVESNSATATLVESTGSGGADLLGGETDDHFEHICDDDKEDSSHARRSINSFANWERLRPHFLRATVEELCIPEGTNCCVCLVEMATIRCTYCGPRQFFSQSCAYTLHETRNQLRVMEQWTVNKIINLLFVFLFSA